VQAAQQQQQLDNGAGQGQQGQGQTPAQHHSPVRDRECDVMMILMTTMVNDNHHVAGKDMCVGFFRLSVFRVKT
jgi:hypothetical protein